MSSIRRIRSSSEMSFPKAFKRVVLPVPVPPLTVELTNCERHPMNAARRDDGGDTATVRQSRVEDGLLLRNIVAKPPCDVLDGDH